MKALFCHNNIYLVDPAGRVYSEPQFGSAVWERYLEFFDEIIVVARSRALGSRDPASLDRSERPGVSFRFLPNLSSPVALLRRYREAERELSHLINGVDAVIVRGTSELAIMASRIARHLDRPYAAEVVGCAFETLWNYGTWQGRMFAPLSYLRTRRMVALAPYAIYVSDAFLQRRYPCRGYISNASNVDIDAPEEDVLERRIQRIRATHIRGCRTVGLIGSLVHRHKGLDAAMNALALARGKLPAFRFKILGNGDPAPWRELADRLGIADLVEFCGTLPSGGSVLEWLDSIDLYLQPSLTEGLPRATIEAMSRGCPALASTAGELRVLLPPEELHRPGDYTRLASQLENALIDTSWQEEAARRNFHASKRYARAKLVARRREFWNAFAAFAESKANRD